MSEYGARKGDECAFLVVDLGGAARLDALRLPERKLRVRGDLEGHHRISGRLERHALSAPPPRILPRKRS